MKKNVGLLLTLVFLLGSCLKQDALGPSPEEQLKNDLVIIDQYLASKSIVAQTDPDNYGVKYVVNVEGTGVKPTSSSDSVTVNYTLKLLPSESQIEKSSSPTKFLLANLIPGWQIGLPLIKEGSKSTFYIPSGWGYGSVQSGAIPANSNLIYEIELVKVVSQLKKDTIAINTYLDAKGVNNVIKDPSGLRYVITILGTGAKPVAASTITFSYTGKFLSNETTFDQSSSAVSSLLSRLIKGFRIAMPLLPVGTKATLYIPSVLGYGPFTDSSGKIPGNSNLIFDIELVSVK
jgi:FKBP-type peptidyl-prolyl cis-trans isomerase FkpA